MAHMVRYGNGATGTGHPTTDSIDGQPLFLWPFAMAVLRAAGQEVHEPSIIDIDGPESGEWAELVVDLPNGGTLTTIRLLREEGPPDPLPPHRQEVTGIELERGTGERAVVRTDQTGYAASERGTVTITDTGTGTPPNRTGRVRITPAEPFGFNDRLSYLRGNAGAIRQLFRDRDANLFRDFLIEHIPSLYDSTALYPFPGVAVRPEQAGQVVPVPAPAFEARSTRFDGANANLSADDLSVSGGNVYTLSFWFRRNDASWTASRTLFQMREGSTVALQITTATNGRITVNHGAGISWTSPTGTFATQTWHHVMVSVIANAGGGSRFHICVDGGAPLTGLNDVSGSDLTMEGMTIGRTSLGATTTNSGNVNADIGHFYLNLGTSLDFSDANERAKFIENGQPVNLGGSGQLPTGTAPLFYFDGGATMANFGTAGAFSATDLATGGAPTLP